MKSGYLRDTKVTWPDLCQNRLFDRTIFSEINQGHDVISGNYDLVLPSNVNVGRDSALPYSMMYGD